MGIKVNSQKEVCALYEYAKKNNINTIYNFDDLLKNFSEGYAVWSSSKYPPQFSAYTIKEFKLGNVPLINIYNVLEFKNLSKNCKFMTRN